MQYQQLIGILILLMCVTLIVVKADNKLQVEKIDPNIVVYWGQNSAAEIYQIPEKPIDTVCSENYAEFIIISFLNKFFDFNNWYKLPGINLSFHCQKQYNHSYPDIPHCSELTSQVRKCQSMGKKVLMSLGGHGAPGSYYLTNDTQAIKFAHTIWDLLLGGQKPSIPRPFDDVILDGVDLDIESGTATGYAFFVKTLHSLMMADTGSKGRKYYISGAPHCSFPDKFLGPGDGTALGDAWSYFNFLSIRFYNSTCSHPLSIRFYNSTCSYPSNSFLQMWYKWSNWTNTLKPAGPKLYIGLQAQTGSNGYVPPGDLIDLFNVVRDDPAFAGAMVWDASWAEDNVVGGKKYYEYVHNVLKNL